MAPPPNDPIQREGLRPTDGHRHYNLDYRIVQEIGRGGQGIVYLAEDRIRGRKVALKVLREVGGISEEALERLRREVEAAARLDHPGICAVHQAVLAGPAPYIAMRYVEGRSLAQGIVSSQHARDNTWIARPGTPDDAHPPSGDLAETDRMPSGPSTREDIERVLEVMEKAARALHAAHEAKVIHRDVKPSNIMVTPEGEPVVLDFGLAHFEEGDHAGLTRTGEIWGTPAYLSPEQLVPKAHLDRRTDVWSLGVTLYECLTLRRPFDGATNNQIFHAIQAKDPVDPCRLNRALPADLRVVIETALEKNRDRRYETALALAEDLRCVRERRSIAARPIGPVTRFSRWARRNPALAASLLLTFCIMTAGLVVTVGLLIARDSALRDREVALFQKTRALIDKEAALRRSDGLRLLAESTAALARDPGLALLLAIEGARLAPEKASLVNGTVNEALSDLREIRTLAGHLAAVDSAEFSPDGRLVVTASADGVVRVWDVASGGTLAAFVHERVARASFSPSGQSVISLAFGGSCRIWGAPSWTERRSEDAVAHLSADAGLMLTHRDGVAAVCEAETGKRVSTLKTRLPELWGFFSPDGKRILTVARDGTASIWASETGERLAELPGAFPEVRLPRFSPDGRQVVAFSKDKGQVWNVEDGHLAALDGLAADVHSVSFNHDGSRLLGLSNQSVTVWDAKTGTALVLCGPEPGEDVRNESTRPEATFTIDGQRVVGASCDGTAHVWNAQTGEELRILSGHSGDVRFVGASPDRAIVMTSSSGGTVTLWDSATWTQLAVLRGHSGDLKHASFSADGAMLVTASADRTARIWAAQISFGAPVLDGHQGALSDVRFSNDGKLALTASTDGKPRVWSTATRKLVARLVAKKNLVGPEFSPDGSRIVALCEDGTAVLFESATGALVASLRGESNFCNAAFGLDGSRVVTASDDGTAIVWDARTGSELVRLIGHEGTVHFVGSCAEGSRIVTASEDKTVRLWDPETGSEIAKIPGHGHQPPVVSPDGRRIVVTSAQGGAHVHDASSGRKIASLPGNAHGAPMFRADGRRLATECLDGTFRVWDPETAAEIAQIPHEEADRLHGFSPDGRRILTTTKDGTAQFWDAQSGRRVAVARGQGAAVTDAHYSPNGRWVVISSSDDTRVFDSATESEAWVMTRRHGSVKAVRFSPDSDWLLAGYAGGLARLWPSDPLARARALKPRDLTLAELEDHDVDQPGERAAVMRLFEDTMTNDELVETLERRADLSDELRKAAISAALMRNPSLVAEKLRRRSWVVVLRPSREPEQYVMALRWAETALRLAPGVEDGLTTLGAARFRAGLLREALDKLEEAIRTTPESRTYARAKNSIFIAMVHSKLGEHEQAATALSEAQRVLAAAGHRPPEDLRHLLAEAESMVAAAPRPASR